MEEVPLCVLCVSNVENVIQIFEPEGAALNINEIIIKHFWIQPNPDNANDKVICRSCWAELSSFHEFYGQIEEAHLKYQKALDEEDELKLNNVIAQLTEHDTKEIISPDFLDPDIKLEVKEDAEFRLKPDDFQSAGAEKEKDTSPARESRSSIHESAPASSSRTLRSADKSQTQNDSSSEDEDNFDRSRTPDWQNKQDNSDNSEEDSDYEDSSTIKTAKLKESPKGTKKRGRPRKGESRDRSYKKPRNSEEASLKRKRIQEFDEMIAQNMKLSCAICQEIFLNFAVLKRHFRSIHNECGYVICCMKKFRKRGVLVDHICTHQNPEYFKCEKCGRVMANRKGLDSHMLTHDTEKRRIYQCDQCTLSFYTRPLLTRHLQTHISERSIKCPECDKFFSTQDILRTHINNVHNLAYTRICDQCGKSFRRPDAFRRHQLEHDGITQPMVPCEKCNVKLTSKYGLKRHMESMHPEQDIKHVCTECGKIAPSAAALQRHISYMHKMERKYKCPMCDKAFKKTGGLKEHMTTHTGEVLYTCPHCPKTFNSNANMHSHRKKMHRKEWEENRRHPHMGASANTKEENN